MEARPVKQWLIALLSLLGGLLAVELVSAIVRAPTLIWNEVRITRSVAMLHGLSIYPGRDAVRAVIGTLHTPISHCVYLLVAGFRTPTSLMVAGSALSVLVLLGSLAWVLIRAGGLTMATAAAFLFCGFLTVQMPGTYYALTGIHTDATALALATVACGILCGPGALTRGQIWISGAASVLVVASKQTLFPLALGIIVFLAVVSGWRPVVQFLTAVAVTGIAVLAAISVFVPPSAFFFNTVTLAAHRPRKNGALLLLADTLRTVRLEALPALFPMGALLTEQWVSDGTRWRVTETVRANRWLVFAFAAACLAPVCAKATITVGGDVNHLGLVLYLLFVGAALGIQESLGATRPLPRLLAAVCAAIGIIATVAPGGVLTIGEDLRHVAVNDSETAFQYVIRHGDRTYFPWDPAAALLASGKLYHFDYALYDRDLGHAPLTPQQMQAGLPAGFTRVAIPAGQEVTSEEMQRLVSGWTVVGDGELPGWRVFEKPRPRNE